MPWNHWSDAFSDTHNFRRIYSTVHMAWIHIKEMNHVWIQNSKRWLKITTFILSLMKQSSHTSEPWKNNEGLFNLKRATCAELEHTGRKTGGCCQLWQEAGAPGLTCGNTRHKLIHIPESVWSLSTTKCSIHTTCSCTENDQSDSDCEIFQMKEAGILQNFLLSFERNFQGINLQH